MPPTTTSVLQLCDQGIIDLTKRGFQRRLMEFIVQEMDKDEDSTLTAPQIVKRVSMLKAINWISESWNELKPETITRCWKRGGLEARSSPEIEIDHDEDTEQFWGFGLLSLTDDEFNEWIRADNEIETNWETTDEDILDKVRRELGTDKEIETVEDEEEEEYIPVSGWDAKAAIDTLKKYLRQCEDSKPDVESLKLGEINRFVTKKNIDSL